MDHGALKAFVDRNFLHFNAGALAGAARGWTDQIAAGNKMIVTLAGAMSTAEIGITLAEMIREGKVHAISCTGANLEEDVYKLVAHEHYRKIPNYEDLSPQDERALFEAGLNRVTDTCIPEGFAMQQIDAHLREAWRAKPCQLPHQYFYDLLLSDKLSYQADPDHSWLLAAAKKDLPLFVPGWADSSSGNVYMAEYRARGGSLNAMKGDLHYMDSLIEWYESESAKSGIGFFQIGGGIAGDFPLCVVPLLNQDMGRNVRKWSYYAQVSDAVPSYGGYSGCSPNEKITWGKLEVETPKFFIQSDATIVAPLIFSYVLAS